MRRHNDLPTDPQAGVLLAAPGGAAVDQICDPTPMLTPQPAAFALNEHREVWDAIPWVVAGTATPEQGRMVEDHVVDCQHCSGELAWQRQIHRGMQDPPQATDLAAVDAGLQRLWERNRQVDAEQLPGKRGVAGNDDIGAARASVVAARSKNKRWLILAVTVAAQAMTICVLGVQIMREPTPDYFTLNPPTVLPPDAILRMVPNGHIDMYTLRSLLNQHGLRIVGADEDASGLLLAPQRPELIPASSVAALAEHLRGEPGVKLVLPVVPQATR